MAAFLPIAVLVSLLAAGAAADGYGSPSTPAAPYTPPPATPKPAPYTPPPATPTPASSTPPPTSNGYQRKLVVVRVEGLVLCQSCAHRGSQSLDGAAPLPGAKVTVTCRDRKNRVMAYREPAADYNGYFHAEFGVEHADDYFMGDPGKACFVRLLSSPKRECDGVTNINGGMEGARLRDEGKRWTDQRGIENVVYSAGQLAFKPAMCVPNHQWRNSSS